MGNTKSKQTVGPAIVLASVIFSATILFTIWLRLSPPKIYALEDNDPDVIALQCSWDSVRYGPYPADGEGHESGPENSQIVMENLGSGHFKPITFDMATTYPDVLDGRLTPGLFEIVTDIDGCKDSYDVVCGKYHFYVNRYSGEADALVIKYSSKRSILYTGGTCSSIERRF